MNHTIVADDRGRVGKGWDECITASENISVSVGRLKELGCNDSTSFVDQSERAPRDGHC